MNRFVTCLSAVFMISAGSHAQSLSKAIRDFSPKDRTSLSQYWKDYKSHDQEFRRFVRTFPSKATIPRLTYIVPIKDGYMFPYRTRGFREEEGLVEYISHLPPEYVVDVFFREARAETREFFFWTLLPMTNNLYPTDSIVRGIFRIRDSFDPELRSYAARASARWINDMINGIPTSGSTPSLELRSMTAQLIKDSLVKGDMRGREMFPDIAPSVGAEMPDLLYDQLCSDETTQKLCMRALKKITSIKSRGLLLLFKKSKFRSVRSLARAALMSQMKRR